MNRKQQNEGLPFQVTLAHDGGQVILDRMFTYLGVQITHLFEGFWDIVGTDPVNTQDQAVM